MKTLVWADVHNRTSLLKSFLDKSGDQFGKRIFLGDWFDQFGDRPVDADRTARLLVELMEDPRNVFIEGNHDTSYRYYNGVAICSGFEFEKLDAIKKVMNFTHWSKFKLYEYEQGWLCSHAGVCEEVFCHPMYGVTLESIEKYCGQGLDAVRSNIPHPVYAMGKRYDDDSSARLGGITWLRWWDFRPVVGLNQIVGHTIVNQPEVSYARKKGSNYRGVYREKIENVKTQLAQFLQYPPNADKLCSLNFNIDCNNRYFATIEGGQVNIHLTLDYL